MIDNEAAAKAWVASLPGVTCDTMERLDRLIALLAGENARQNLVSVGSLSAVWQRHIADSAQLLAFVPRETRSPWLDLGTGAGFPGLVIAAIQPACEVVMVESRARRVEWLSHARSELGLNNAKVIGERLEKVPTFSARVISARAFAPLNRLLELSARFSTEATVWLLPKGRSARQELQALRGWHNAFHVEQSLTDREAGVIVGRLNDRKERRS